MSGNRFIILFDVASKSKATGNHTHMGKSNHGQDNSEYTRSLQTHGPDQLPYPFEDEIGDDKSSRYRFYDMKNEYPCPVCHMYRARAGRRPDFCDVCRNVPDCEFCRHDYPKTGKERFDGFSLGNGLRVVEYIRSNGPGKKKPKSKGTKRTKGKSKTSPLHKEKEACVPSVSRTITLTYDELDDLKDIFQNPTGSTLSIPIMQTPETGNSKRTEEPGNSVVDWENFAMEVCEEMTSLTKHMEKTDKRCIEAHDKMDELMKSIQPSDKECAEAFRELSASLSSREQLLYEAARVAKDWSRAMEGLEQASMMQQTMPMATSTPTGQGLNSSSEDNTATTPMAPTAPITVQRHCSPHRIGLGQYKWPLA
ncbi:hypothetical protein SODALDRAFT_324592 [Sodiomyces alkalinus F11]|uniref:Uncharacterized protein n=1 Tax=Sodiomyces alkalinus (strain CBS 110278 / VKM F-3762 / F11) TaxID=1314773 RepID=A0A3N2PUL7_SODAK|nr:hypothetical protein SODALDRAFT_324592 [Sodiomyces alkalinus F11]ROT38180.1 hypothetical protein SODALDRAFT_324592 [Sodiomyces alkalinus F11]